jgi:tungstate transport system ATP-binding protein
MLFQRPFLLHLSVRRNVRWRCGCAACRRPSAPERCHEALQRVGLAACRTPARQLSGGQQQRLALARAWALQPDMMFLDEPTASLDPSAKREVEALVAGLARRRRDAGDEHAQPRPGQAPGHAGGLPRGGRVQADLATERFFDPRHPPAAAAAFLKGELPWT